MAPKKDTVTVEISAQEKMRKIKEANRLVRIRVTCMDPNKKGWKGDFFTVMNPTIGTVKKFIPFNTIWHVPVVLLKQLKRKKRQEFYEVKAKYGLKIKRPRMVPMYAIEELPDLTKDELDELARKQAMNHSIDE